MDVKLIAVLLALLGTSAAALPVSQLSVHIVNGAQPLLAGSDVELRIYEVGGRVLHLPLTHGEAWAPDSTRVIPLVLSEPLDPRLVQRYSIFYRSPQTGRGSWEIADAAVDLPAGPLATTRLLDTHLSGAITQEGELSTEERSAGSLACIVDADCDDHRSCNGVERCVPHSAGADARGCVKGDPVVCPVNEVCVEKRGCVGMETINRGAATPATHPPPAGTPPR
jgi:hypothetical protein